jgi:sulfate/thiosulfate transport system permease protein
MSLQQISLSSVRDDLRTEPKLVRFVIITIAVTFLTVFVVLPLVMVFAQAFSRASAPISPPLPIRKRCRRYG